jgi:hypothetical protein
VAEMRVLFKFPEGGWRNPGRVLLNWSADPIARTLLNDPSLTLDAIAQRAGFANARQLGRLGVRRG